MSARADPRLTAGTRHASRTRYCEIATADAPLRLQHGQTLGPCTLAYETYGELNAARDNAILVFHALTGHQHAAGYDPVGPGNRFWSEECHRGWWDPFIGEGCALDTSRYFVVCANYLGGCYGSTGPSTIDPLTGQPWGSRFPWPSLADIVDSQIRLLDRLGIERLLATTGGSLGGMCAMDLACRYPERVRCVIPIASGLRATVLSKALNFEQIFAIQEDPEFRGGDYYDGPAPQRGLALARMISHKTFVSLEVLRARARAEIVQPDDYLPTYRLQDPIESYMLHQGRKFVRRFDANSYLRISNAWQAFDLARDRGAGDPRQALAPCQAQRWLLFSIDSDACFYPTEQAEIAEALRELGISLQYVTVHSDKGHDAFLLEPELFQPHLAFALRETHETKAGGSRRDAR
ncbi:MAG: homoserine O-acetyltransferase [Proteobacteria bacterium]|nr:homoserine O-acetyltransferase [Pseudomonadota bacterium]